MLHQSDTDAVFRALADPTRRAIVGRLAAGPASVGALAEPFQVTLTAIGQHLKVLEGSGLVRSHKVGRVRVVELVPETLLAAEQWFASHRAQWQSRLDRLGDLLAEEGDGTDPDPDPEEAP